ncbi:hypothetical protein BD414DRAFT_547951 [Trametes punicea]|nr:hypothetical protein BD414DRAFT_547951 [Trametes punicea]
MALRYPLEDNTLSDSGLEQAEGSSYQQDSAHIPLLPFDRSWSPGVLKEKFATSPALGSPRRSRLSLPLVARRRTVLLMIVLVAGSIPLALWTRLNSDTTRELEVLPEKLEIYPPIPEPIDVLIPPAETSELDQGVLGDSAVVLPEYLRPEAWLAGTEATVHVKDSLRNDTGYLTSFLSAGFTNDQITIGNLIYLALITDRVPILPPFTSYINAAAMPLPFSEIFDVPRMSLALDSPILEWHMVKDSDRSHAEGVKDELGCWNIWEVDNVHSDGPRGSYSTVLLNLDISYTRAPAWLKLYPGFEHDSHSSFWSLAKLAFSDGRNEALANPGANPTRPSQSNNLLCYDYLYYVCALETFEFEKDYSPMWREVMVHAHWTPSLEELARGYLRRLFRLRDDAEIPPFIAIHARRGDFSGWCGTVPQEECFAPLSAFARRVAEVQEEVRARHGVDVQHVIMTGDEQDPLWWASVEERGWARIDHDAERTAELYGNWYPVVLDAVVQSMAIGFVGTDRSTFSHMGRRRVMDWNQGAVRLVKWGYVGADDH